MPPFEKAGLGVGFGGEVDGATKNIKQATVLSPARNIVYFFVHLLGVHFGEVGHFPRAEAVEVLSHSWLHSRNGLQLF